MIMKNSRINIITIIILFSMLFIFNACKDEETPLPPNEEELITTVSLAFENLTSGAIDTFIFRDADGPGGNAPTQFDTIQLDAATTYHLTTTLLNESVSPSEDITVEVQDEGVDHQFFYTVDGGLDLIIEYDDTDANGNPIGIHNIVTTGVGGAGAFTVILKHQPGIKDGNITTGDTDVEVDFETKVN